MTVQENVWKREVQAFIAAVAAEQEEERALTACLFESLHEHSNSEYWENVMVHSMVQLLYAGRLIVLYIIWNIIQCCPTYTYIKSGCVNANLSRPTISALVGWSIT